MPGLFYALPARLRIILCQSRPDGYDHTGNGAVYSIIHYPNPFTAEQAEQHRKVICPDCSKWDFYAALNMVYSEYASVAKKMGVDRPEYYAHMAKAFLCDEDAEDGKLVKYKEYIAG